MYQRALLRGLKNQILQPDSIEINLTRITPIPDMVIATIASQIFYQQSTNQTAAGAGVIFAPKRGPPSCRETEVFSTRLGKLNTRQVRFKHSQGSRNPFRRAPTPNKTDNYAGRTSKQTVIYSRNSGSPEKRSDPKRCVLFTELLQPNVLGTQERGLIPPRDRSKSFKCVYSKRSLPNGRPTSVEVTPTKGGFSDQIRPQGRVFSGPDPPKLPEVSQFHDGKSVLPILLSPVRIKILPQEFSQS